MAIDGVVRSPTVRTHPLVPRPTLHVSLTESERSLLPDEVDVVVVVPGRTEEDIGVTVIQAAHVPGPIHGLLLVQAPVPHIIHLVRQSLEHHLFLDGGHPLHDEPHHLKRRSTSRNKVSESSKPATSSSATSSFTFGSLSDVAETVSAAVKRVTGGNSMSNRYKLLDNKSPHNPVAASNKSSDDDSSHIPVTTSSSTLVDIPLPKDSSRTDSSRPSESVPYIGPQLPPELAERFGLSMDNGFSSTPTSEASEPSQIATSNLQTDVDKELGETPSTYSSSTTQNSHSNSLNLSIPPEQVEQYRALQEQAKQHALRRTNLFVSDSTEVPGQSADYDTQAQLALLQQLGHNSAFMSASSTAVSGSGVLLPSLSSTGLMLNSLAAPVTNTNNGTGVAESWMNQHLAQLSYDLNARQMSLISAHQANALNSQMQRQQFINSVAQMTSPQLMVRTVGANTSTPTAIAVSKASAYEAPGVPAVVVPAQIPQQLQQAQLQQMLNAAAAFQVAQSNSAASIQAQANQSAVTSHLLQQLSNQQSQVNKFYPPQDHS
ncbi:unnamed protein product [Echinostoma caproni]|uniref:POU domain protein n=1 Tax=Echinostoma caproni TaxID=27848 RepID=A0A183ABX8_9TREM|nr:unnamed protein product [Echinostoma caproni]